MNLIKNDEFEVISYELKTENRGLIYRYYSVKILSNGNPYVIKLMSEISQKSYEKDLEGLKKKATNASIMLKRNAWSKYYNLLNF